MAARHPSAAMDGIADGQFQSRRSWQGVRMITARPARRILSVVGARPQFIKAAVVSRALLETPGVEEILIHTGQHYDRRMSQVFFDDLSIPRPAHDLGIGSDTHARQTGRMMTALEKAVRERRPDWVLVYGDTNSTMAAALVAAKLDIPVAHVEAGLRSFNRTMPEEINRIVTDRVSTLLFAPTETAANNLRREGMTAESVHLVGDVMYDATRLFAPDPERARHCVAALGVPEGPFILATLHRAENTDDPVKLDTAFRSLVRAAEHYPVVIPLHPRTQTALERTGLIETVQRHLICLKPIGYPAMLALVRCARLVATDSGGLQKEAFILGTPCLTLRGETEWVELVELGWNRLVPPTDENALVAALTEDPQHGRPAPGLYGGGEASRRIAALLAVPERLEGVSTRLL